ncbi:hypothetical protein C8J56DRAFT_1039009 [Mycena floridula]|nr:hypothetical protein C8J56DRAFT_1039009 [Mycena floridula]
MSSSTVEPNAPAPSCPATPGQNVDLVPPASGGSPLLPPIGSLVTPPSPSSTASMPKLPQILLPAPSSSSVNASGPAGGGSGVLGPSSPIGKCPPFPAEPVGGALAAVLASGISNLSPQHFMPLSPSGVPFYDKMASDSLNDPLVPYSSSQSPAPSDNRSHREPSVDTAAPIPSVSLLDVPAEPSAPAPVAAAVPASGSPNVQRPSYTTDDLVFNGHRFQPIFGPLGDDWVPDLASCGAPVDLRHFSNRHILGTLSEKFASQEPPLPAALDELLLGADNRNHWMHPALQEFRIFYASTDPEEAILSLAKLGEFFESHNNLLVGAFSHQLDFSESSFAVELHSTLALLVNQRGYMIAQIPPVFLEVIAGPTLKEPSKVLIANLFLPLVVDFGDDRRRKRVLAYNKEHIYHRPIVTLINGTELMGGPTENYTIERFFGLHPVANVHLQLGAEMMSQSRGKQRAVRSPSPDPLILGPTVGPSRQVHQPLDSGSRWAHLTAPPGIGTRFRPLAKTDADLKLDDPPPPGYTVARQDIEVIVVPEKRHLQMLQDAPIVPSIPPCHSCVLLWLTCQPSETLGNACRRCHAQNRGLCSHKSWLGDLDAIRTHLQALTEANVQALCKRMPPIARVSQHLGDLIRLAKDAAAEYNQLRFEWIKLYIDYVAVPGGAHALTVIPRQHYKEILEPIFKAPNLAYVHTVMLEAYKSSWLEGQGFPEPSCAGVDRIPIILAPDARTSPPPDAYPFWHPVPYTPPVGVVPTAPAAAPVLPKSGSKPSKLKLSIKPSVSKQLPPAPIVLLSSKKRKGKAVAVVEEVETSSSESSEEPASPPPRKTHSSTKHPVEEDEESSSPEPPKKKTKVASPSPSPSDVPAEPSESEEETLPPAKKAKKSSAKTALPAVSKTGKPSKMAKIKPATMEAGTHTRSQPKAKTSKTPKANPLGRMSTSSKGGSSGKAKRR